jgi:3-dehydroquinate synthase
MSLYGRLLKEGAGRDALFIAIGGGTVGDSIGFLASTYLRGVDWVGVPTTLLAQVDSSIGGKTGVNHSEGKNLIGSFYQPKAVICETSFLKTLSSRELISGWGEIIKYAMISDWKWVKRLESIFVERKIEDLSLLTEATLRAVRLKAERVSRDEFDRKQIREALNFGHTFGHALESLTGYQYFQHGEAVIWGMRFAIILSQIRKKLSLERANVLDQVLRGMVVPPIPVTLSFEAVEKKMLRDKKVRNGKLNFVLLQELPQKNQVRVYSDSQVTPKNLREAFEKIMRTPQ